MKNSTSPDFMGTETMPAPSGMGTASVEKLVDRSASIEHSTGRFCVPGTTFIQPFSASQSSSAIQAATQVPGWTCRYR